MPTSLPDLLAVFSANLNWPPCSVTSQLRLIAIQAASDRRLRSPIRGLGMSFFVRSGVRGHLPLAGSA